jgi:hypothetical protein
VKEVLHPADRVEERADTRHRDYILTDYEPAADPAGRLHSSSVLHHALRAYGMLDEVRPILETVERYLGRDETVWGFKTDRSHDIGLELYFYNFTRNAPPNPKRVSALVRQLQPLLSIESQVDEGLPYFMCSLDLGREMLRSRRSSAFRIYLSGERLRDGYDGISYLVAGSELRLENYYTFYRAAEQLEDVRARASASIRSGDEGSCRALLPEHLSDCHAICYATKPLCDALYFSRISTPALTRALTEHFPGPLVELFRSHPDDFAHLRWDLGYDFRLTQPGSTTACVDKVGLYGIL